MKYFVRPETNNEAEGKIGPVFGPFRDFLQISPGPHGKELRVGPNGDPIAHLDIDQDLWFFTKTFRSSAYKSADARPHGVYEVPVPFDLAGAKATNWLTQGWTDLIIWAEA